MTAFLRAFVVCDGCGQPLDTSTVPSAESISEALRDAKRNGWTRKRGRRDLCQGCDEAQSTTPAP
ncbi:hypothetical protein OG786_29150 [Streptomyces sp. NBC_00101]|uniref:hypothetical protein n=1 Tax=Streptomyces sp. NBC_00101 TaxID=2975651 RepID=UPI003245CD8C